MKKLSSLIILLLFSTSVPVISYCNQESAQSDSNAMIKNIVTITYANLFALAPNIVEEVSDAIVSEMLPSSVLHPELNSRLSELERVFLDPAKTLTLNSILAATEEQAKVLTDKLGREFNVEELATLSKMVESKLFKELNKKLAQTHKVTIKMAKDYVYLKKHNAFPLLTLKPRLSAKQQLYLKEEETQVAITIICNKLLENYVPSSDRAEDSLKSRYRECVDNYRLVCADMYSKYLSDNDLDIYARLRTNSCFERYNKLVIKVSKIVSNTKAPLVNINEDQASSSSSSSSSSIADKY